jgi:hypothetical protein
MQLIIIHQSELTENQRLLIDIYYNDGHTYEFLVDFFVWIYPYDRDLVIDYIASLFITELLEDQLGA